MTPLDQFIADARKLCEPYCLEITTQSSEGYKIHHHPSKPEQNREQQALSKALDMIEVMQKEVSRSHMVNSTLAVTDPKEWLSKKSLREFFLDEAKRYEEVLAQISKLAGEKV